MNHQTQGWSYTTATLQGMPSLMPIYSTTHSISMTTSLPPLPLNQLRFNQGYYNRNMALVAPPPSGMFSAPYIFQNPQIQQQPVMIQTPYLPDPIQRTELAEQLLQRAHGQYNAGDYLGALSALQEGRDLDASHIPTLLLLGCTCYSLGMLHLAVVYNEQILGIDGKFAEAYSNLGTTYRAMAQNLVHNPTEWIRLIGSNMGQMGPVSVMTRILLEKGQVMGTDLLYAAEGCYRHAIEFRPTYWDAAINLAGMLSVQGREREALQVYETYEHVMESSFNPDERLDLISSSVDDKTYAQTLTLTEKRRKRALKHARQSGMVVPVDVNGWTNERRRDLYSAYANLLFSMGDVDRARRAYLKPLVAVGLDMGSVFDQWKPGQLPLAPVNPNQALGALGRQAAHMAGTGMEKLDTTLYSPVISNILQTLARLYQDGGKPELAASFYYLSLSIHPTSNSCNNLGILLAAQRLDEATSWYELGLHLDPAHVHLYTNLGSALKDKGDINNAILCYQRAIALQPDFYIALANLANVFKDMGRTEEAIDLYRQSLRVKPEFVEAFCNLVNSQLFICDWKGREANLARISELVSVNLRPGPVPRPIPMVLPFHTFTYSSLSPFQVREIARINAEKVTWIVQNSDWFKGFPLRPRDFVAKYGKEVRPEWNLLRHYPYPRPPPPPPNPHIRIGYVSSDFVDHPLAHLMQSVFGLHDKTKFQVYIYSLSPSDNSEYRKKIERECHCFVDVSNMAAADIVERIVQDGIHMLVNLNGYTKGGRNEIFAARPTPLSMIVMGYAATMGAGPVELEYHSQDPLAVSPLHTDSDLRFFDTMSTRWIDWFFADEITAPRHTVVDEPSDQLIHAMDKLNIPLETLSAIVKEPCQTTERVYTENMVYMPNTYFVPDHKQGFREELDKDVGQWVTHVNPSPHDGHITSEERLAWTREQVTRLKMRQEVFPGLREDTIIFANFNQLYKMDPIVFKTWLHILVRVPNSILWLLRFPPAGERHLKQFALEHAGPDIARRVIFTDVASKHVHIYRGRIADVFLDTPECNAHTTAADILWSGTPLITIPKYPFKMASRVAASCAYATGEWPKEEIGMLVDLVGDKRLAGETIESAAERLATEKAEYLTGSHASWKGSRIGQEIRTGVKSRLERLSNPLLLGHFMVCKDYQEYEDRAVSLAKGVTWKWHRITSWDKQVEETLKISSPRPLHGTNADLIPRANSTPVHPMMPNFGPELTMDPNLPGALPPFFPTGGTPTHIYTPSGPLITLRRRLFLSRERIPLFDTGRWVRDLERGVEACMSKWMMGWKKMVERNERELRGETEFVEEPKVVVNGSIVNMVHGNRIADAVIRETGKPVGIIGLASRCIWIKDEFEC